MSAVIPKLRFQCFKSGWSENKLSHFCYINPPKPIEPVDGKVSFIPMNAVTEEAKLSYSETVSYKSYCKGFTGFQDGDAIFAKITPCFENGKGALLQGLVNGVGFGSTEFHVLRAKEGSSPPFIHYLLNTPKFRFVGERNMQGSAGQKRVTTDYLRAYKVYFPKSNLEQQKIADFLTSVDTKISQLTEKHRLLKDYKKGVMQQIFSQQIRFKNDDGNDFAEWKEKNFNDVFNRVTAKNKENNENVLTISAQKGLISQLEYFNKSVSAKDVTGYYLLHKGDFAYNKSYSKGYPMGAIKPLKFYEKGVVSTLYICFRPKADYCEHYFEQYFDAGMLNREIAKIAQEGARNHGLLNVSVTEFFEDIKLTVPHIDEQQKIAQFLQSLDKKIDAVNEQIEQTKLFKKGLLQQMFV